MRARQLPARIPAVVADALDFTPEEELKQRELARIGWREAGWHGVVSAAWFGAALGLGGVANAFVHYGNAAAVLIMSGAFAGLLAPVAISSVRRVNAEFSGRRLALEGLDEGELGHLSPRLRELVLDTRVAMASIDGQGIAGDGRRAVFEWLRSFASLDEADRWELHRRGIEVEGVRRIVLDEDLFLGALSRGQRRRVLRRLRHLSRELSRPGIGPYR